MGLSRDRTGTNEKETGQSKVGDVEHIVIDETFELANSVLRDVIVCRSSLQSFQTHQIQQSERVAVAIHEDFAELVKTHIAEIDVYARPCKEMPASKPESLDLRIVEDDRADGFGSVERERIAGAGERSQTVTDEGGDEDERERAHARIADIVV